MGFISKMLFLFVIALLLQCTKNIAGNDSGGTETTNALVVISEGMSVRGYAPSGTSVIMCNETFNPLHDENFIDSVIVDSSKSFIFKTVTTKGKYNILAINGQILSGAFISGLNVDVGSDDSALVHFDSLGNIDGTILHVNRFGTDTIASANMPVYIEGTSARAKTDSIGIFHIGNVPLGTYRVKLDQPLTGTSPVEKIVSLSNNKLTVNVTFVNIEGGE
jgi:hypothetical protein